MGSAKEPETLQLLKQEAVLEDAHQSSTSLPCSQEKASCLPNIRCDGGDLTMRNCCVNDLGTKESSQEDAMVDNPNQKEKAPSVDTKPSVDVAAATDTVVLKETRAGESPLEGELATGHDLRHGSEQDSRMKELPSGSANTCSRLEGKAAGKASPADEKGSAGEACQHLPVEPCLRGASKDPPSAPASLKHVAFLEPTKNKAEAGNIRVGVVNSEVGPALLMCQQKTIPGQPGASTRALSPFCSDICEAAECLDEGHGNPLATEVTKESAPEPVGTKTTPGELGKASTDTNQLSQSGEMKVPVLKTSTGGSCSVVPAAPAPLPPPPPEIQCQGTSGESQTTTGQPTEKAERLKEATPFSTESKTRAQEQPKPEAASVSIGEEHTMEAEQRSVELLAKTCSFEVTPPQQDAGTQVDNRVTMVSIAVSPINPPDGSTAFTFHTQGSSLKSPGPEQKPTKTDVKHTTEAEQRSVELLAKTCSFEVSPPQQDAGTQVDNRVTMVSIAVSPINPPDGSTAFTFHTQGSSLKSPGPEQKPTKTDVKHTAEAEQRSVELLAKTCSFEVSPPQQDAGTQVDNRVSMVSIAVSPINPPDGSTAFTFHTQGSSLKSPGPEQEPTKKDVEMQVSIAVETRSVATGPMTPVAKSPQASYPEVHVKGAQEETPEPVREVSWDEKGMTWEVYGASMEVEVLGMAIQKHLEKQIEEHGRQVVMTPQSTRTSSIKGPPRKGDIKRQPSVFRALLQNVRRPRCCSRGGPAVE
ncbi:G protein-regulated inducer of neurite outgrowth 1 isoform X2 [Hemicordylus capensis]|nr:G protein-regulated inducer of neurite outgrowth 1 isoform X2 [Hemicordylus capensis]XP_053148198.1 G protein-regulated inducer of neurite outgrowth 1 isoform X2 [Hemicordylus capensis]XP_053148199.1 G protein-regulated inducer of neurite outgrowth 1 isoform X2 [Hemicordylus capensis]